ncbi:MAG: VTT domain-containing protein [Thiohalocapsa sp.]
MLKPGRNCWRIEKADRLAVLVDGEEYFGAVRRAMITARHSIAIAGWDIHSELELIRDPSGDGHPTRLADLLMALLELHHGLDVYVLLWDYASIYALERESLFLGDNPWQQHPRLHFVQDDQHPPTASHHQKLVIIDGLLAFCGGFDLSRWRWDTATHDAEEPRRVTHEGEPYQPFHDVQVLVDGDVAAALMDLFRERWRWATGDVLVASPDTTAQRGEWPAEIAVMLRDQAVAIARTLPEFKGRTEVREVERLYLDLIEQAETLVYIENQYLSSRAVRDVLCRSLAKDQGPQIVIVLPRETGAWLEQHTMDILRARVLERLRNADSHGRLRVYFPDVVDLSDGCLMVHAKLMVVDDSVLRVGSSNLSNRSMGLDSECDLCIVAERDDAIEVIRGLRHRLLGMFLSVTPEAVAQAEREAAGQGGGGPIQAIETLRAVQASAIEPASLRLADLSGDADPEWERQLPDERIIDPDRPIDTELLTEAVVGGDEHLPYLRWRVIAGLGLVVLFIALAAAWRWTALGEWLQPELLSRAVNGLSTAPWGPPVAVAGFVCAAVVAVPVTLLILVSALAFGSMTGALVAFAGSVLAALAGYGLGAYLGRPAVERMTGGSLERLSRRLARHGILTVVTVRIVPLAPFAVINLFAGASHLGIRDYLLGTALGMAPAILGMSIFAEGLISLVREADLRAVALLLVGVLAIGGLAWYGRRMLKTDD